MTRERSPNWQEVDDGTLHSQALIVTDGPFVGRICLNDDDDFVPKSELKQYHLQWLKEYDVTWEHLKDDEEFDPKFGVGIRCEIVTFGHYLQCRGTYMIPRQFLKPATTDDLVSPFEAISELVFESAWRSESDLESDEIISLLKEKIFIMDEIWSHESIAKKSRAPRDIFLCHSSVDKNIVKRVWSDLAHLGYKPWLDEFEIDVGESIVEKISESSGKAHALVLFLSKTSVSSNWVKREWSSALSRQLATENIKILPAMLDDCDAPPILADIKFADFRESYDVGLSGIVRSIDKLKPAKKRR